MPRNRLAELADGQELPEHLLKWQEKADRDFLLQQAERAPSGASARMSWQWVPKDKRWLW